MSKKEDLRVRRTHKLLYTAFLELVSQRSIEDLTITDVCERAMVNRATFYKHFDDKYDFFCFCIKQLLDEFKRSLPSSAESRSVIDYYILLLRELLLFVNNNRKIIETATKSVNAYVIKQMVHDLVLSEITESLEAYEKSGAPLKCSVSVVAEVITGALLGVTNLVDQGKIDTSSEDVMRRAFEALSKDIARVFTDADNVAYSSLPR
ncbi:MAG: TetR/AcrR family transcriptional regulator [Clostridia bacterium]|nr:TetR/AcrR family transcriptional regulator [Clostridia bacterium]